MSMSRTSLASWDLLKHRTAILLVFWPSIALAQSSVICRERKEPTGDLGIGGFQCVAAGCGVNFEVRGRWRHSFTAEPYVWDINPRGPSTSLLQEGDRVAAIDDILITTPDGGERMANVRPGERVSLTVRRAGRLLKVPIVATLGCNMPYLAVTSERGRPRPPPDWRP